MVTNNKMKVNPQLLKAADKPFTKITGSSKTNKFPTVCDITHMNTGSNPSLYQSWKKHIVIKFIEVIVNVLVIISSTKMCVSYNSNLQRSSPRWAILSISSSIKYSNPLLLFFSVFLGLYTSSTGRLSIAKELSIL